MEIHGNNFVVFYSPEHFTEHAHKHQMQRVCVHSLTQLSAGESRFPLPSVRDMRDPEPLMSQIEDHVVHPVHHYFCIDLALIFRLINIWLWSDDLIDRSYSFISNAFGLALIRLTRLDL